MTSYQFIVIGLFNIKRQYYIFRQMGEGYEEYIFEQQKIFFRILRSKTWIIDFSGFSIFFFRKCLFWKLLATNSQWARLISWERGWILWKKGWTPKSVGSWFWRHKRAFIQRIGIFLIKKWSLGGNSRDRRNHRFSHVDRRTSRGLLWVEIRTIWQMRERL